MPNNTFEDYKIAVKNKYEEVRNSEYFVYLDNPTRAKLRNLCWELFQQQNRNQDDLNVFSSLLGLPFDVNRKNKFDEQIDKFRPIEKYFKGETDPANVEAVNMAAILVNFELRPFNKFRIHNLYPDDISDDNLVLENQQKKQIEGSGDLENFLDEKEREKGIEKGIVEEKEDIEIKEKEEEKNDNIKESEVEEESGNEIENEEENSNKFNQRIKNAILGVTLVLCIGFGIIFFAFPKKQCMQWSVDHYELVDCDLKIEGFGAYNKIELLDPTLVNLKKIAVCDTTTYFDKNGIAVIWYGRTANGVDFFNAHGRHPENSSPLKPVTKYILNKYVRK
ncbi:hypothetical protein L0669_22370 [Flavobacterium bizetiae]|uniref:hypothetical protein n=1 Tax=Flavobacterium bizetiae TaxID=2704140 RepID=UPI0021E71FC4|nr:hypothetical protein [Flavobacterium bizetiae]UTN04058.1 hypothetical protein L0669_22370 [Flavobacterium bizetiae]